MDGNQTRDMIFQVCDVTKVLGSVSGIVKKGNRVVFDDEESYIENQTDGSRALLRERLGVYVLDVWVAPYKGGGKGEPEAPFHRRGGSREHLGRLL